MKTMANELKETLAVMTVAAGSSRDVETGGNLYFTGKKMALFNGDVFIEKDFESDFTGGVNAGLLESVVDKYGSNEIEISRVENELVVKCKRSVSKLTVDDNSQFPKITLDSENEWRRIPADFCSLIDQAVQMTGNSFNEPVKVCVHMQGRYMEAGDGFHFGIFKMKGNIQDSIFIRKDFVKILLKFEPAEYCLTETWICFRNAKGYFVAVRKITIEDYPNLSELYNGCKSDIQVELPDKVISSLERAGLFLKSELEFDKYVSMEAKDGKIDISTSTKAGSYSDAIPCADGVEFSIKVNPKYLVSMLYFSNLIAVSDSAVTCETSAVRMASCLVG